MLIEYKNSENVLSVIYVKMYVMYYVIMKKKQKFVGPRFLLRLASLEMHPLDQEDRIDAIKNEYGSGMCNITRCCTDVCPEHIQITDNSIIPLKERVVDRFYDPIQKLIRKIFTK